MAAGVTVGTSSNHWMVLDSATVGKGGTIKGRDQQNPRKKITFKRTNRKWVRQETGTSYTLNKVQVFYRNKTELNGIKKIVGR